MFKTFNGSGWKNVTNNGFGEGNAAEELQKWIQLGVIYG
jgi:hypothetical protein